jgi:hypothetical protein
VKGIPALLSSHDLLVHFGKYAGSITDIYFPKSNMEDGERSQYCFVSFVEPASVQLAVSSAPHIINGLRVGQVGMCVCVERVCVSMCVRVCVYVCVYTHISLSLSLSLYI